MYETHFGLKKRPFRAHAAGTDVFVGPQTAATIAGLKKALANQDSIVIVSGPIGVGKTTLVRRALDAVGNKQTIISLGRMHLGHDEVLELLLGEMGVTLPAGTVQRFTTFRRLLKEHAEQGSRVIVVVEDATRIGTDALSELEALTASDAGVSDGANIVLMGDQGINEILKKPQHARLKQRLRLRQSIAPFSVGELTGYLKHCFRLAGQEYDTLFEDGTAAALHVLSDGIPRMANNLVESALAAAADAKISKVTVALIQRVAIDEYGLEVAHDEVANDHHIRERRAKDRRAADRRMQHQQTEEPIVGKPSEVPEVIEAAVDDAESEEAPADDASDEIPELIQDTLPDLAVLAPALANEVPPEAPGDELAVPSSSKPVQTPETDTAAPQPQIETEPRPDPEPEPEISAALEAAQVGASDNEIPEWERDPTLAELRPDLDALEHAMLVAQGLAPASDDEAEPEVVVDEPAEPVPEITLDREIQAKIDEATDILKQAELEAEEHAAVETEGSDEAEKPLSEILAKANEKAEEQSHSIESQLDATDAFALDKIGAVAAAEQAAEAAIEMPEIPVLETPASPVPEAPTLPVVEEVPPPVAEAPTLPVVEKTPPPVAEAPTLPVVEETPPPVAEAPTLPAVEEPTPPVEDAPTLPVVEEAPPPIVEAPTIPLAEEELARVAEAPTPPVVEDAPAPVDAGMRKIAAGLSRAKTIDDIDDKMAETLFGEEFSLMAAEIAANVSSDLSANDDFDLTLEESATVPVADVEVDAAIEPEPGPELKTEPKTAPKPAAKPAAKPEVTLQGGSPNLAATQQRLATLRALNANSKSASTVTESIVLSETAHAVPPAPVGDHPEPIEEQINTSITQTLKALSVRPPPTANDDEEEDDEEKKGGFFSRFRRS